MADDEDLNDDEFRLPTTERLKQSRKKRAQQLKKYAQYDKQVDKESAKKSKKLEKAVDIRQSNNRRVQFPGSVTLLEAATRDDREEVRRLLRMSISPDVCNDDGLTALHQCCIDDSGAMLNVLLEFGANVNATDCELWTPLHAAATCGRINICRRLIENGANLLAVNGDGNMPYDICDHEATLDYIEYEMAKQGITQELIDETRLVREKNMLNDLKQLHHENGVLEFRGRNGETPLHVAAANGYLDVAEFLLSHRVPIDTVDNDLWQPIHCAACWGQLSVLELLLEHGASLEAKTSSGTTALDICEDLEMKQKILEIKEEIENSRLVKSRELSRRHSSTIRRNHISRGNSVMYSSLVSLEKSPVSASVRRTSMREKKELSWKEAKEEARRMRESTELLRDMDDEEADVVKDSGVSSPAAAVESKKVTTKSSLLSPIVSIEETLDVRFKNFNNSCTDELNTPPIHQGIPSSPQTAEPLVGRGINFEASPPPRPPQPPSSFASKPNDDAVRLKTNGLPQSPPGGDESSGLHGTLSELKKQRSYNRLSEAQLNDVDLLEVTTKDGEKSKISEQHIVAKSTEASRTDDQKPLQPSSSSNKALSKKADVARKCCILL